MSDRPMKGKMLHERLRGYAEASRIVGGSPTWHAVHEERKEAGDGVFEERWLFDSWAGEIERCYIPRPRFDDGELVEVGSRVDGLGGEVTAYDVSGSGAWCIYGDCGRVHGIGPVKRPDVLDADGVPVKVGDVLYSIVDGRSVKVRDIYFESIEGWCFHCEGDDAGMISGLFSHKRQVFDADGAIIREGDTVWNLDWPGKSGVVKSIRERDGRVGKFIVECVDEDGKFSFNKYAENLTCEQPAFDADGVRIKVGDVLYDEDGNELHVEEVNFDEYESEQGAPEHTVWCGETKMGCKVVRIASQLSHREPDSLEKIEQGMRRNHENWVSDPNQWLEMADRIAAIVERGA